MKLLSLLFVFLLFPSFCFSEANDDFYTMSTLLFPSDEISYIYHDDELSIIYDSLRIDSDSLYINCICENNTDHDLEIKMYRCNVNGWDVINGSHEGHFTVHAHSKKRESFPFFHAVSFASLSDVSDIQYYDYSIDIRDEYNHKYFYYENLIRFILSY